MTREVNIIIGGDLYDTRTISEQIIPGLNEAAGDNETGPMMVGVKIHPADEAKLETACAKLIAEGLYPDEDACVDAIFRLGLSIVA